MSNTQYTVIMFSSHVKQMKDLLLLCPLNVAFLWRGLAEIEALLHFTRAAMFPSR